MFATAIVGLTSPVDGSVAGPSYVPASTTLSAPSRGATSGGTVGDTAIEPIQTRKRGWIVPIERLGGSSVVSVAGATPTLLRLRLPIGTQATNLRVARVELPSDTSTASLIVAVNGTDVERVRARSGQPVSIPLANDSTGSSNSSDTASGAGQLGDLSIEIRLDAAEPGTSSDDCGPGSVRLRGIRLDVEGTPTMPTTIDELLPRSLEELMIVLPRHPDHEVATAALRLATAAKFHATPGLLTAIVSADDVEADGSTSPWRRVVRLQPSSGPGRIVVDGPSEATFAGRSSALVSLVGLLDDPTVRSLPAAGVRITTPASIQPDLGGPAIRSFADLTTESLVSSGDGEAAVSVGVPRRVGLGPVGTLQAQVRGLVKADRPVAGITVTAELSGLTVGTATVDGRSGTFTFPFAVRHLADTSPHELVVRATSSDDTVNATCPGRLASVTLIVDPQSTFALGADSPLDDSLSALAYQLPVDPIVAVDPDDAAGLSLAAATLALAEEARDAPLSPVVEPPSSSSDVDHEGPDLVVVASPSQEATARPDVGVQPLRLTDNALPAFVDSDQFASLSLGGDTVRGHRQVVMSVASPAAGRVASSVIQGQSWPSTGSLGLLLSNGAVNVPNGKTPRLLERFDAGATPPNELGLAWPETPSSGHRILIGMGIGAVAVLLLRIIVRTHRTVSRVPERPRD